MRFSLHNRFSTSRTIPLIRKFINNVLADGGTVDEPVVISSYNGLHSYLRTNGTFAILGPAYKSGIIYAMHLQTGGIIPVSFTRAGAAQRRNSSDVLETVASGIPRSEYTAGGVWRGFHSEKASTNYFINSTSPVTQTITVTNAATYTVSVRGTGSVTLSGAATGTVSNGTPLTVTTSSTSLTVTVSGSLNHVQVEDGNIATSEIWTGGAAVTRPAERAFISLTDLSWDGTKNWWYSEHNRPSVDSSNAASVIRASTATSAYFRMRYTTTQLLIQNVNTGGTTDGSATLTTTEGLPAVGSLVKATMVINDNDLAACINGGTVLTDATLDMNNSLVTVNFGTSNGGEFLNEPYKKIIYIPVTRSDNTILQTITA